MIKRILKSIRRRLGIQPKKPNLLAPFGSSIRAPCEEYLRLHEEACSRKYPSIDKFVGQYGRQVDLNWLRDLALHTQVVIKQSALNYQHGRVLYSVFGDLVERMPDVRQFTVLETGTSRGYSAICISRALTDMSRDGKIITIDVIEHNRRHLWNCIDDHEGPKTRQELLARWPLERDRIVFLSGDSGDLIERVGLGRIHFAFLDGSHTEADVLSEYAYVRDRQVFGDMIVFDDVTPGVFDGIVQAVEKIRLEKLYTIVLLQAEERRAYAIATRVE